VVSGQGESRSERGGVRVAWWETSYEAYASARERFFATLRADAEIRRLERLWCLVPEGLEVER
jgi:hypothetical protein